ncbi:VWA domain-containing protein [Falsibacillus pallidus]|uniref:VWA domain-containing protein n=1 Tax=Falsibacillus pallidus TaxID=493781 RepID=UPI003D96F51C
MINKITALIIALFLIGGCSNEGAKRAENTKQPNESTQSSQNQNSKKLPADTKADFNEYFSDIPDVPKDTSGFINQQQGEYAGLGDGWRDKLAANIKDLPPLPEKPTEKQYDQYFKYIYSLVAEDFPDPKEMTKKLEFSMYGNPDLPDNRYQFKDHFNIEIILDSSGSMAKKINGKSQMELAKDAIQQFISKAPEDANISLRVYGHKGTGSEEDKQKSCSSIEQVYGFKKFNKDEFSNALNKFKPSGWTPIASALEKSKKAFEGYDANENTNLIYLVSDGIETCGGDPVDVAKSFGDSNISPIINVIGFNVDSKAQKQLQDVATSANGFYSTVSNGNQLTNEFKRAQQVLDKWDDWKKGSLSDAHAEKVNNDFEILGFMNDWNFRGLRQGNELRRMANFLQDQGKYDYNRKVEIYKRIDEIKNLENQTSNDLREELNSLSNENYEKIKKEINEKYNSNTNSN